MNFLSPEKLALEAIEENLYLPDVNPQFNDIVPTMNRKGFMVNIIDSIAEKFIEQAINNNKNHLEIGSAYGNIAIELLHRGCKNYTAIDLDLRHLKILSRRVKETHPNLINNIKLIQGSYPKEVKLEDNSYDSILISRVLHFLSPDEILAVIADMHRILKPQGRIYVICASTYNKAFSSFIPIFEEAKKNGVKYPGYTREKDKHTDLTLIDEGAIKTIHPGDYTFFDHDSFAEFFEDSGFEVKESIYIPYNGSSVSLDGRENVGAIMVKK
jgi:ubiquinone/menaquinone biosynthesis C-methylase UbiE